MTVIVAAYTSDGIIMAADAQTTYGWQKVFQDSPKLWVDGDLAFGCCGSTRNAQVFKYHVDWPIHHGDDPWESWLVRKVVPAMKEAAKSHGVLRNDEGIHHMEASMIICTTDSLGVIADNGAVLVEGTGRMAIGSGYAEALGRLGHHGPWTEGEVIDSVQQAAYSNTGCHGPVSVLRVRDKIIRTVE